MLKLILLVLMRVDHFPFAYMILPYVPSEEEDNIGGSH